MPGLFGIFELGRNALLSYQTAINTSGHNVSNAGTPGYHRQRVDLRATYYRLSGLGTLGNGVIIRDIQRVESRFIDAALEREAPVLARYRARADILSQTELIFGEPSDAGVTTVLDQFFDGWDDLASNPEDSGARESVVRLGIAVADTVRGIRGRLSDQRTEVEAEIQRSLGDANRIVSELANLNATVLNSAGSGGVPPDLADRRDLLLSELGELVGTTATIDENGTAIVRLGGRIVLQADRAETLRLETDESHAISLGGLILRPEELDGSVAGLVQVRDDDLIQAIRRLDEFALRLADEVNSIHEQGFDSRGDPAGAFFVIGNLDRDGVTNAAAGLLVAPELRDDSARLAAGAAGGPGENSIALDVAALRHGPLGIASALRDLVVDFGMRTREAQDVTLGQEIVVDSFHAQKESITGVSLDEEAANLLRFQRSYQAAARVMTIADELAELVLAI